jgi:hypothetical protein
VEYDKKYESEEVDEEYVHSTNGVLVTFPSYRAIDAK